MPDAAFPSSRTQIVSVTVPLTLDPDLAHTGPIPVCIPCCEPCAAHLRVLEVTHPEADASELLVLFRLPATCSASEGELLRVVVEHLLGIRVRAARRGGRSA